MKFKDYIKESGKFSSNDIIQKPGDKIKKGDLIYTGDYGMYFQVDKVNSKYIFSEYNGETLKFEKNDFTLVKERRAGKRVWAHEEDIEDDDDD